MIKIIFFLCCEGFKGLWKCTLITFKGQILSPQTRGYVAKLNVQDQERYFYCMQSTHNQHPTDPMSRFTQVYVDIWSHPVLKASRSFNWHLYIQ